ncbi:MAG: CGGC domain-containing protein [Planctomycetota bacterium]|jgi:predicted metal-binding protein|nr:CGGC domain-containing protein [Planctomycetota bacterium]
MSSGVTPVASPEGPELLVVVQCHSVTQAVCPGFLCEHAFQLREGGFAIYPKEKPRRYLAISCGGCPGRSVLRKLKNLLRNLAKREKLEASAVVVHLSTCITRESHHGPRCPHIGYIQRQVAEAGLPCREDSRVSTLSEAKRREGRYQGT